MSPVSGTRWAGGGGKARHTVELAGALTRTILVSLSGSALPLRGISGSNTKINNPISIALDPVADELFVDSYDVGGPNMPGILVFNLTDSGNVAPKRFITGSNTPFGNFTNYVTLMFRTASCSHRATPHGIVVFNLTDSGNVAPKRNLTGSATRISPPGADVNPTRRDRRAPLPRVARSKPLRG